MTAGADLSAESNRYKIVKLSAANTVVLAAADTDVFFGTLERGAISGQPVHVQIAGMAKVRAGAAITAGARVSSDAAGKAKTGAVADMILGTAVETAAADTEIIWVKLSMSGILLA